MSWYIFNIVIQAVPYPYMPLSVFILETACPSASWTVGPVLLQVLPSFPSWASCPMSRTCPFQKWLSLVSISPLHANFSFIICKEMIEDVQISRKVNVFFLPICFGNYLNLDLNWTDEFKDQLLYFLKHEFCFWNMSNSRSRFGFHSLPPCCVHDALLPSLGLLLLHYDCLSGTRQPSENNIKATQTENATVLFLSDQQDKHNHSHKHRATHISCFLFLSWPVRVCREPGDSHDRHVSLHLPA